MRTNNLTGSVHLSHSDYRTLKVLRSRNTTSHLEILTSPEPVSNLMPKQNLKISCENNEFGGEISRYLDEKFVIYSRYFKIMIGKQ